MNTIAIIGGGNMGEALIKGLYKNTRLIVCEADLARVSYLKKKYRVTPSDIPTAVKSSSIIVLAVKPQDMAPVLEQMRDYGTPKKLMISIAAGLTTSFFERYFPKNHVPIVRSMPNMPALIDEGITAICPGKYASPSHLKAAQRILSTVGEVIVVKESMIDAVTAVSGSGPAYLFLFVEQWMASARALGFNESQAKELVYKTLLGSAHLLSQSQWDASTLRQKVTSKGGTTQAALDVFSRRRFDLIFKEALKAAKTRAKELAK